MPLNEPDPAAPPVPPPSPWRRRALTGIKLLGLIALVWVVLQRFDLAAARESFTGLSASTALLLLLCFTGSTLLRVAKWGWQVRGVGLDFAWLPLVRGYLVGVLLGVLTPMRVGEVYRLAALDLSPPGARGLALASLVLEKVYELTFILLLVTLGLALSFGLLGAAALVGGIVAAALTFSVAPARPPAWARALIPDRVWAVTAGPMLRARDGLSLPLRLGLLAATGASHLVNLAGGLAIFRLFGELDAASFFLRLPVITLVNAVPITVSGIGLRELGAMEVFGPLGFPESGAAAAATLLFVAINGAPLVMLGPVLALEALQGGSPEGPTSALRRPTGKRG